MRPRSLRLRQLSLAAASLVIVLAVAGYAFASIFADHTERSLATRLTSEMNRLVALVDIGATPVRLTTPLPDARYETPAGGLYWQVRDSAAETLVRSRSLWDSTLEVGGNGADATVERVPGPAGQQVLAVSQTLIFDAADSTEHRLQLAVAESLADVEAANAAFQGDLLRALAFIALALLGTYWLTVEIGLAPLGKVKRDVASIRSGDAQTLAGPYPTEIGPLVAEVNELLALQEQSIDFARERAADLAHGLKTSLTLMNGQAFELRRAGNIEAADRIEALTNSMADVVDHQLKLSRLRHRVRSDRASRLAEVAGKVVAAVKATPRGRELRWSNNIPAGLTVKLDAMDLSELLGVLVENASEWAAGAVCIEATITTGRVIVRVSDDGPGLEPEEMERLGQRGRRLDEQRPGTGLGLAIAREIVTLNGGKLAFERNDEGGLAATVTLPSS